MKFYCHKITKYLRVTVIGYLLPFFVVTIIFLGLINLLGISVDKVLFFRGIKLLLISGLFSFGLLLGIKKWKKINIFSLERLLAATMVAVSINLVFFVVFPVTFERSISMYLLNQLKNGENSGLEVKQLIEKIEVDYIEDKRAVEKRIIEQLETGFINVDGKTIKLTDSGKVFLYFSEVVSKLYGLDKK